VARLREILLGSARLFADETTLPVLDPGRGRTKTGYAWAIARWAPGTCRRGLSCVQSATDARVLRDRFQKLMAVPPHVVHRTRDRPGA
jgi:hypothetical protein